MYIPTIFITGSSAADLQAMATSATATTAFAATKTIPSSPLPTVYTSTYLVTSIIPPVFTRGAAEAMAAAKATVSSLATATIVPLAVAIKSNITHSETSKLASMGMNSQHIMVGVAGYESYMDRSDGWTFNPYDPYGNLTDTVPQWEHSRVAPHRRLIYGIVVFYLCSAACAFWYIVYWSGAYMTADRLVMRWRRKYPILGVWQTAEECFEEARELSRELQFYQYQFTKRDIIDRAREHIRCTEERYPLYNHHLVTLYEDRPFPIKLKPRMKWNGRRKYKEIVQFRHVSDDERPDCEIESEDERVKRGEATSVHWRTAWKRKRQERPQSARGSRYTKPQTQEEVWNELRKLQMLNGIVPIPKPKSRNPRHGQAPLQGGTYLTVAPGNMSKHALVHAVHAHLKNKPPLATKASPPAAQMPAASQLRYIPLGGYKRRSSPSRDAKAIHALPKSCVPMKAKEDNSKIRHERMRMVRHVNEAIQKTYVPKSSQELVKPSQKIHLPKNAAESAVNLFAPKPARKVKFESVRDERSEGPAAQSGLDSSTFHEPRMIEEDLFSDDDFDEPHRGVYMRGGQGDKYDPSGDIVDDGDSEYEAGFYSDYEAEAADNYISIRGGLSTAVDPAGQTVNDQSSPVEFLVHCDNETEAGNDATAENVQPSSAPVTTEAEPSTDNPSASTQSPLVKCELERPVALRVVPKVKWFIFAVTQTRRIAKENALPENATSLLLGIEKVRMHEGANDTIYGTVGGDCAAVTLRFRYWDCVEEGRFRRLGLRLRCSSLAGTENPEDLVLQAEKTLGKRLKKEEPSYYIIPPIEDDAEQPIPPSWCLPHVVLERSNYQNDDQHGGQNDGENGGPNNAQYDRHDQSGVQESNGDQPFSDATSRSDPGYKRDDVPSDGVDARYDDARPYWDSSTSTDSEGDNYYNEGESGAPAPPMWGASNQFFNPLVRNPALDANDAYVHRMTSMDQRLQNLFISPTAGHALALSPSGPPMGITWNVARIFFAIQADADGRFQDAICRNQSEAVVNQRRRLTSLHNMRRDFMIGGDGNTHVGSRGRVSAEDAGEAEDTSVASEDKKDTSMRDGALDDDKEYYEDSDIGFGVDFEPDDKENPFKVDMARLHAKSEAQSSDGLDECDFDFDSDNEVEPCQHPFEVEMARILAEPKNQSRSNSNKSSPDSDRDNEFELKFDDEDDKHESGVDSSADSTMRGGAGDEHGCSENYDSGSGDEIAFYSDDEYEEPDLANDPFEDKISMHRGAGGRDAQKSFDNSSDSDAFRSATNNEVEYRGDNDDEDQTGVFTANGPMIVSGTLNFDPGHHLYEQGGFHESTGAPIFASLSHHCRPTDAEILQTIKGLNLKPKPQKNGPLGPLEQRIDDLLRKHGASKTLVGALKHLKVPQSSAGAVFGDDNEYTAPETPSLKPTKYKLIDQELADLLPILTRRHQDLGPAAGTVFERSRKGIKVPQGGEHTECFYRTAADEERRAELKTIYKSNKEVKKAKLAKLTEEKDQRHPLDAWAREMELPPIRWSQNEKYSSIPSKKVDVNGSITGEAPSKMWTTALDVSEEPSKKEERRPFFFESKGPNGHCFMRRVSEDPDQLPTSTASFTQRFPEDPTEAPAFRKLSLSNSGQPFYKMPAREYPESFGSTHFLGLAKKTRQETQDAFESVGRQRSVNISKIGYYKLAPSIVPSVAACPALPRSAAVKSIEDEFLRPASALPPSATLNNTEDELLHPVGQLRKEGLGDLLKESSNMATSPKQPVSKVIHRLKPEFIKPKPYCIFPTFPVSEELSPGKSVPIYKTSADFRAPLEGPKPLPIKVWYGFLIPGYRPKPCIKRDGWLKCLQNKLKGVPKLEPQTQILLPTMKERIESEAAPTPLTPPGTAFVKLSDIERTPKKRISDYLRPGLTPTRQTSFARHGKPVADPHCDIFVREKEGEIQLMPPPKALLPSNILNATAGPPPKTALPPLPDTPGHGQFVELQDLKPPPKAKEAPKFEDVDISSSAAFRRLMFGRDEDTTVGPLSAAFTPNMELPQIAKRAAENPGLICMMVELYDGPIWDDGTLSPMKNESPDTLKMPTTHNLAEHNSAFQDIEPSRRHSQQLRDGEREHEFDYGESLSFKGNQHLREGERDQESDSEVSAHPDLNYEEPGPLRCLDEPQHEDDVDYDFAVEDRVGRQNEDDLYYAIPVEDRVRRRMSEAVRQFQDALEPQFQETASYRQHNNSSRQRADQPARARFCVRPGTPIPQPGDHLFQYKAPRERASASVRSGISFSRMEDDPRNEPRFQSIIRESASREPQGPKPVRYEQRSREARAAANHEYIDSLAVQPPAEGISPLQAGQRVYSLPQTPPRYGNLSSLPTQRLDTDVPSLMQRTAKKVKRAVTCGRTGNSNVGKVEDSEVDARAAAGGVFGSPASGHRRHSNISSNAGRQHPREITVAKAKATAERDLKKAYRVQEQVRRETGAGRPWYEQAPTQSPANRAAASVKSIFHRKN